MLNFKRNVGEKKYELTFLFIIDFPVLTCFSREMLPSILEIKTGGPPFWGPPVLFDVMIHARACQLILLLAAFSNSCSFSSPLSAKAKANL